MGDINYQGDLFAGNRITPAIQSALEATRAYGLALIKARTPIDTGRLKAFWQAELNGRGITWKNNSTYADYVEFGTRKMSGRFMLTDSLPEILETFEDNLYREIGRNIGGNIIKSATTPTYDTAKNAGKQKALPGGRSFESPLINALSPRNLRNRGRQLPGRKDLISPSQAKKISQAKPRWQKAALKKDQRG